MKSITVRDVPDDVVAELASRAAADGRSLQEYLRLHFVGLTARPDINYWLEDVRVNREAVGAELSIDEILAARDEGRR